VSNTIIWTVTSIPAPKDESAYTLKVSRLEDGSWKIVGGTLPNGTIYSACQNEQVLTLHRPEETTNATIHAVPHDGYRLVFR